jgi:hypothetical protein
MPDQKKRGKIMQLETIEARFNEIKTTYYEPDRTTALVQLMDVLETQYGTFQSWQRGTQAPDLETPEMVLYRAISAARS